MIQNFFYNGILYQIEYKPRLSNNYYTKRKVFHIKTEDTSFPHAKKAIASIIEEYLGYSQGSLWSKGTYEFKNMREPSMINALHIYYEFSYNEDLDVYEFTVVIPYDD